MWDLRPRDSTATGRGVFNFWTTVPTTTVPTTAAPTTAAPTTAAPTTAAPSDDIGCVPHMEEEGFECFKQVVAGSSCYLEYGSGASTIYASTIAKTKVIISVESDPDWVAKVRKGLSGSESTVLLDHCDVGEVGPWGTPTSKSKAEEFWKYPTSPWRVASSNGHVPDVVLIDGRFRVACFLFSLISAKPGTTLLFDDYFDRPHYSVVEEFCEVAERRGRMAVFRVTPGFSVPDLCARFAAYSPDWA
jgi:hypothetical protein